MAPLTVTIRRDLLSRLGGGSAGGGEAPRRHAVRRIVIAMQCGGAAMLLVLAVMFTRSFANLLAVELGWNPERVLSLSVYPQHPPEVRRPWALYRDWSDRLIARLESTPGIVHAAISSQVPFSPQIFPGTIARGQGKAHDDGARWSGVTHRVTDGYMTAMGIRLLEGRAFEPSDRFTAAQLAYEVAQPEAGTAIVTMQTARLLWPGESAIGKTLWLPDADQVAWRRVVGIVEDVRFHGFADPPGLHVFTPWTQGPIGSPRLLVRGGIEMDALVPLVRQVIQDVDSGAIVDHVIPLEDLASRVTAQPRFTTRVVGLFSVLTLLLAAVGVHGTLSYIVHARKREIGIRLAIGATPSNVVGTTLRAGLMPALIGAVLGTAAAIGAARSFRTLLFELAPLDIASVGIGAGVLVAAATVAAFGPARYAGRIDPVQALRAE